MKVGKPILSEPRGWKTVCAVVLFWAGAAIGSPAQTFNTVLSFDGTDGAGPGVLIQGFDGNF